MAEEYHQQQSNICSQNWWSNNSSTNNPSGRRNKRYESGSGAEDPSVEHDTNKVGMTRLDDSLSVSGCSSSMLFLNNDQMMPGTAHGSILSSRDGGAGGLLVDTTLQHMCSGSSSQGVDWDQALLHGGKSDPSSFRSMLEEDHKSSSENFQPEIQWKPSKLFTTHGRESSLGRSGFSLDQHQFSSPNEDNSTIASHNLPGSYIENPSSVVYGGIPSSMLQSILGPSNKQPQQQQAFFEQRVMEDYSYGTANYGTNSNDNCFPSDNKFPQFMRNSPSKQQPSTQNQLLFSNNAPYWNSSSARVVPDVRASFMPSPQLQCPMTSTNSSFEEKPKNTLKEGNKDLSVAAKKSGAGASMKRPRNESSPSTLPPFKAKKEKMGDRITALQQLVSPFGKTDTASVLSESIEYIKILHEQVLVLTGPYMKNCAMMQHHHQPSEKFTNRDSMGPKQGLRSRGLCLVPFSSTFPVTPETTVDFWTPTFGGPLR